MITEDEAFWISLSALLTGAALLIAAFVIAIKNQRTTSDYMKSMAQYQEERSKQDPAALSASKV